MMSDRYLDLAKGETDPRPGVLGSGARLRENALFIAVTMEELAEQCGEEPRSCYTVGLLRSIGKMALEELAKDDPAVQPFAASGETELDVWEKNIWGMSNCDVAEKILVHWRLPHETVIAIKHHYHPAGKHNPVIHLLTLAAEDIPVLVYEDHRRNTPDIINTAYGAVFIQEYAVGKPTLGGEFGHLLLRFLDVDVDDLQPPLRIGGMNGFEMGDFLPAEGAPGRTEDDQDRLFLPVVAQTESLAVQVLEDEVRGLLNGGRRLRGCRRLGYRGRCSLGRRTTARRPGAGARTAAPK